MRSPDEVAHDEEAREYLRALAAMAGDFYSALRDAGVPDEASVQMIIQWHDSVLEDGIVWESGESE